MSEGLKPPGAQFVGISRERGPRSPDELPRGLDSPWGITGPSFARQRAEARHRRAFTWQSLKVPTDPRQPAAAGDPEAQPGARATGALGRSAWRMKKPRTVGGSPVTPGVSGHVQYDPVDTVTRIDGEKPDIQAWIRPESPKTSVLSGKTREKPASRGKKPLFAASCRGGKPEKTRVGRGKNLKKPAGLVRRVTGLQALTRTRAHIRSRASGRARARGRLLRVNIGSPADRAGQLRQNCV